MQLWVEVASGFILATLIYWLVLSPAKQVFENGGAWVMIGMLALKLKVPCFDPMTRT